MITTFATTLSYNFHYLHIMRIIQLINSNKNDVYQFTIGGRCLGVHEWRVAPQLPPSSRPPFVLRLMNPSAISLMDIGDKRRNSTMSLCPPSQFHRQRQQNKLYALRIAAVPGVYSDWQIAKKLIDGCPGAKYKGFFSIQECFEFIWEQFPASTFTKNDNGDYIMDNPELVMKVVEEARQKKQKTSGIVLNNSIQNDNEWERIRTLYSKDKRIETALDNVQNGALDLIKSGKNVFIAGPPSSGKQTILSHALNYFSSNRKNVIQTTCSAIYSLNTQVPYLIGWSGIGKALGTKKQILSKVRKNTVARKAWVDVEVILISHCSMMSMFLFETLDFIAREIRKKSESFGGIQIVLTGDAFGITPSPNQTCCCPHCGQNLRVLGNSAVNVPAEALQPGGVIACASSTCQRLFHNTWILHAFESSTWDSHHFYYYELTKTYHIDPELSKLLVSLRSSNISDSTVDLLNSRKVTFESSDEYKPDSIKPIRIVSTNEEAVFINTKSLQMISGIPYKFEAEDTVLNNFDFSARAQQKDGYTDETLILRQGLNVIVIASDGVKTSFGTIVAFDQLPQDQLEEFITEVGLSTGIIVDCVRAWVKKYPQVPFVKLEESGEVICVKPQLWKIVSNGRVTSWRLHLPLKISTAISMVQAQSMKFSKLIVIYIIHFRSKIG